MVDFDFSHLAPYERAARIFCGMRDLDPDESLEVPHPMGLAGVAFTRPQWHFAAENLINLSQMLTAMKQAAQLAPQTDAFPAH